MAHEALLKRLDEALSVPPVNVYLGTTDRLLRDCREALAAHAEPREAQGWRPIDSAPKDTPVLIGGGGCPRVHENTLRSFKSGAAWGGLGNAQQPTLWHPLPELPAAGKPGTR